MLDRLGPFRKEDKLGQARHQRFAICRATFPARELARVVADSLEGLVEFSQELNPEILLPLFIPCGSLGGLPSASGKRMSA